VTVGSYATCVRVGIVCTAPRAQKICTQGRCVISIRPWLSYPQRQCVYFRFSRAVDWPKFRSAEVEKEKLCPYQQFSTDFRVIQSLA